MFAVFWDVDGTLIDSEPLHYRCLIASLAAHDIDADANAHAGTVGRSAYDGFLYCRDQLGLNASFRAWVALRQRLYLEGAHELRAYRSTTAIYARLREAGVVQALVSNSDRQILQANLNALAIEEPNLVTVSRNDVRDGKPAPEPYRRAAWLCGVEPSDCLVIEDSRAGARAGLDAGMRVIGVAESLADADFPSAVTDRVALGDGEAALWHAIWRRRGS